MLPNISQYEIPRIWREFPYGFGGGDGDHKLFPIEGIYKQISVSKYLKILEKIQVFYCERAGEIEKAKLEKRLHYQDSNITCVIIYAIFI